MKLKIKTGDYREYMEFPITSIQYEIDDNNIPVDIVISGTKEVLESIGEFAILGNNIRALDDNDSYDIVLILKGATHEGLYARLPEFTVLGAKKCIYK